MSRMQRSGQRPMDQAGPAYRHHQCATTEARSQRVFQPDYALAQGESHA
jgi:hypothetical protein